MPPTRKAPPTATVPARTPEASPRRREPARVDLALDVVGRPRGVPAAAAFHDWVRAALAGERRAAELSIRVVGAREGRLLNRRYRGLDRATNVLSFALDSPLEAAPDLIGDIVLCAPLVAREAARQGKPARAHWAHLTVHGVLHLLGYDHVEAAAARRMEERERAILAGLGYPDPYLAQGRR